MANLLAAARHANMYTPPSGDGKYSVLLVPPGMLDIAHYTVGAAHKRARTHALKS